MKKIINLLLVTALSYHTGAQVSLQTGAAEQSFPLVNYSNSQSGLSFGVGLNYFSGNGLKVNTIASSAGTGWSLEAGGMIIRDQKGQPDDQLPYYSDELAHYPAGYLYNENIGSGCNRGAWVYPVSKVAPFAYNDDNAVTGDTEQDIFYYSFAGHTGSFVIDRGTPWTIKSLNENHCIITYSNGGDIPGARTTINGFAITTENGIKYHFGAKSLNEVLSYQLSSPTAPDFAEFNPVRLNGHPLYGPNQLNKYWGYSNTNYSNNQVVTGWYLDRVENLNTGKVIDIIYEDTYTNAITSKYISHTRQALSIDASNATATEASLQNATLTNTLVNNGSILANTLPSGYPVLGAGTIDLMFLRSADMNKRIKEINLPGDEKITFGYSSWERQDLKGDNALEKVSYFADGKLLREYLFTYSYLYKNQVIDNAAADALGTSSKKFLRLCLTSLQKTGDQSDGSNAEPPYKFDYYLHSTNNVNPIPTTGHEDDIVPARNTLNQDAGGYFNGKVIAGALSVYDDHDLLLNTNYYQAIKPEGRSIKAGYAKNGLLKTVYYPTGGQLTYDYQQCRAGIIDFVSLASDVDVPGVTVKSTEVYDGVDNTKNVRTDYVFVKEGSGARSSKWGEESMCLYNLSYNINNLSADYKYVGTDEGQKVLGGQIASTLAAIGINQSTFIGNIIGNAIANAILNASYRKNYSLNITNTNFRKNNGFPTRYSRVEVKESTAAGNRGKTVYEFTDNASPMSYNYPTSSGLGVIEANPWPFVGGEREHGWAYGAPRSTTVFDAAGQKIKAVFNSYDVKLSTATVTDNNKSCWCFSVNTSAVDYDDEWKKGNYNKLFTKFPTTGNTVQFYNYKPGHVSPESTEEIVYKGGNPVLSTIVNYSEDINTYQNKQTTRVITPRELEVKIMYYPTDYDMGTGDPLTLMKDRNMLNVPVSEETWRIRLTSDYNPALPLPAGYTAELVSSVVTEFNTYNINGSTVIKPYKVWVQSTDGPVTIASPGTRNTAQLMRPAPTYYRLKSTYYYNTSTGNLIQQVEDGKVTSFLYDHDETLVTCTASNAGIGDLFYTSFEGDSKGGWAYDPSFITTSSGITGTHGFTLKLGAFGGTIISKLQSQKLNIAKQYYVTFWSKSQNVSVRGSDPLYAEVLAVNGAWKLLRYQLTNVSSTIISGDNIEIDEVRLYPKDALVATSTYKRGIGKTSECDANNRIVYYEYDALGRLKLIRDENKQVLKSYEYNYKSN